MISLEEYNAVVEASSIAETGRLEAERENARYKSALERIAAGDLDGDEREWEIARDALNFTEGA